MEPPAAAANVLVLMVDEMQAAALSCAGHPLAITPNIDRLAERGVRFTNAWTPSPICVPARASFLSGRWVHRTGHWDSAHGYAGEPGGWAHAARAAGVRTTSIGKLHHRSVTDDDGFDEQILPMFIAGGTGWLQGLPRREPIPYDEANELADDVGVGHTTYTRYDRRVATAAIDWIGQHAGGPSWATFVSFVAPHYPLSAPEEFTAMVAEPQLPTVGRRNEHPAVEAMASFFAYGDHFDDATTIEGRRAYFALVAWVDSLVGEVLDALERAGAAERTTVIMTSDHGELLGERGLWCKSFMFEESVRVPMIVAGPDVPAGVVSDTQVNLVDIAPTVTDSLGITAMADIDGRSLGSLVASDADRANFSEYHDGGSVTGSFAVRYGRWKYVHHVGYRPELYDIADDPAELHDRALDPSPPAALAAGEELLRSIVDPEVADAAAFAAQQVLIDAHGGREALANSFRFNHTPAPQ